MKLKDIKPLSDEEFRKLVDSGRRFVLYVRSEKDAGKIKEIFDVDIVFPELAKTFGDKVEFYRCDIDEVKSLSEFKIFFAPMVILFKDRSAVVKLEGIKSWAEYNRAVGGLLC